MTRGEGGGGNGERRGRTSQRTCMSDPGAWTTGWGLIVRVGGGGMGGGGKNWDNCNRVTIKNVKKEKNKFNGTHLVGWFRLICLLFQIS